LLLLLLLLLLVIVERIVPKQPGVRVSSAKH
jgi:hypothetical protein